MSFIREVKRRVQEAVPPVLFLALSGYFVWHSIHGDRGLMAREQREQQLQEARAKLAQAEGQRDAMERRVQAMRGEQLDRDQLDERARALLNHVGKDEMVIPYEPGRRLF